MRDPFETERCPFCGDDLDPGTLTWSEWESADRFGRQPWLGEVMRTAQAPCCEALLYEYDVEV
jgi:hypothetical protein